MIGLLDTRWLIFAVLLAAASVYDLKTREIPDAIPVLLVLVGVVYTAPLPALCGATVTALPYLAAAVLVRRPDGFAVGGGDIKLMAGCGAVLGVWGGVAQSVLSLTLLLLAGMCISLCRRKKFTELQMPLAPFFCAGGILSYLALSISAALL